MGLTNPCMRLISPFRCRHPPDSSSCHDNAHYDDAHDVADEFADCHYHHDAAFTNALPHRVISDGLQQVVGVCRFLQETAAFYNCLKSAMCDLAFFVQNHCKQMVFAHCKVGPLTKAGHAAVWLARCSPRNEWTGQRRCRTRHNMA